MMNVEEWNGIWMNESSKTGLSSLKSSL